MKRTMQSLGLFLSLALAACGSQKKTADSAYTQANVDPDPSFPTANTIPYAGGDVTVPKTTEPTATTTSNDEQARTAFQLKTSQEINQVRGQLADILQSLQQAQQAQPNYQSQFLSQYIGQVDYHLEYVGSPGPTASQVSTLMATLGKACKKAATVGVPAKIPARKKLIQLRQANCVQRWALGGALNHLVDTLQPNQYQLFLGGLP